MTTALTGLTAHRAASWMSASLYRQALQRRRGRGLIDGQVVLSEPGYEVQRIRHALVLAAAALLEGGEDREEGPIGCTPCAGGDPVAGYGRLCAGR